MIELFRSFLPGGGTSEIFYECRACGTVVDEDADRCSNCDSADIAQYEIE